MTSYSFWQKKFEDFRRSHTLEVAELEYLDLAGLEKVSNKDLAYNLKILAYRSDLGNKVSLAAIHSSQELTVQELREDNRKLQKNVQACKAAIIQLEKAQGINHQDILGLKGALIQNCPLSKKDVEELVLSVSNQPKLIEQQTEALTIELTQKLDKVEKLIHRLEKTIMGE